MSPRGGRPPGRPPKRANRYDIAEHARQRLGERYGQHDPHPSMIDAITASIRQGRSLHVGWQRRGSVHAVAGPSGLALVLYANKKVVTALPLDDPYLLALDAYFLARPASDDRQRRLRAEALRLRAELPELGRPWHSFEPRYEHPDPKRRPHHPDAERAAERDADAEEDDPDRDPSDDERAAAEIAAAIAAAAGDPTDAEPARDA